MEPTADVQVRGEWRLFSVGGERNERTHDGMSSDNAVDMGPAMLLEWTLLPKISAGMDGIGDTVENYARDNGNKREGDIVTYSEFGVGST